MRRPSSSVRLSSTLAVRRIAMFAAALLAALAAFTTAARCHEPNTNTVVFIQGLYTTLDDGKTQTSFVESSRFAALKAAFAGKGYGPKALLDYSYAGGEVNASSGTWRPADYACELTDRAAAESLAVLEEMLRAYRQQHPRAHFTLVGHSLGGYLAYLAAAREAARPLDQRLEIDVVVTFDAPLQGVDADKKAIIDAIPCDKTYVAGAQIVADKQDPGLAARRTAETAAIADAGIRLATLGNRNDCLWNTGHCLPGATWVDDSGTQFLAGAAARFEYAIEAAPLESHDAILAHPPAIADAVTFVGAP